MKKKNLFIFLLCLFVYTSNAQELLNLNYDNGTLPTNINEQDIITAYTSWKTTFTESCGDDRIRVRFDDPSQTVSEGIGYGMLIAAYAGDEDLLIGLWNYYNDFLNNNGVMNWKIQGCSTVIGQNGATDAELDVAMALIIANKRWGSSGTINYATAASDLIQIIKDHEVEAGTNVLKPGDAWGGSETTNISYFAPGYYREYQTHTNDTSWSNVASKSYEMINNNLDFTGAAYNLVSDWSKANGQFSTEVASWAANEGKKYGFDASRTPWRIALDYLWYGNSDALVYSNKCIDFINAKNGLDNIYPGYNLDGTPFEQGFKDVTFTGAYAVAAMASTNQNFVNNAYSKVVAMTTDAYFGSTLRVLYLLTLSGNFYSANRFASLSTDEQVIENEVAPYPNPVENVIYISFSEVNKNIVKIYNLSGKLVFSDVYQEGNATINVESLDVGVYLLEVNKKKHKIIKK